MESAQTSWHQYLPYHPIFSTQTFPSLSFTPASRSQTAQDPYALDERLRARLGSFRDSGPSNSRSSTRGGSQNRTPTRFFTGYPGVDDGLISEDEIHRRNSMVIVRGSDLVVAVGNEIRIASLADFKGKFGSEEAFTVREGEDRWTTVARLASYKVLSTPAIDFSICSLVVNSNSKLLAVVGTHQVAVVVLPRKGWNGLLNNTIESRTILVGQFYHGLETSPQVAQVRWHPWGENASTLLVLTVDGILREYDVGDDAEEPAQLVDFCQEEAISRRTSSTGGGPSRLGLSAEDVDGDIAVSFCFGAGSGDWGPLTIYCLMRNGDLYAVSPFVPVNAHVPVSYINALSVFVSTKVDYLEAGAPGASEDLASSFSTVRGPDAFPQSREQKEFARRYRQQHKFVEAMVKQARQQESQGPFDADGKKEDENIDRRVRVKIPKELAKWQPTIQGPFLFQPAPVELGGEGVACDVAYVNYSREVDDGDEATSVGIFVLAFADGKMDVCLEVEKLEAKWDSRGARDDLPTVVVYETIDLGILDALQQDPSIPSESFESVISDILAKNHVSLIRDPLYPNSLYIYHSFGVQAVVFGDWLDALLGVLSRPGFEPEDKAKEITRIVHRLEASDIVWVIKTLSLDPDIKPSSPIVGLSVTNDIYLGYSLITSTSALQVVSLPLCLRVDSEPSATSTKDPLQDPRRSLPAEHFAHDTPGYIPILVGPEWTPQPPLNSTSGLPKTPRIALPAQWKGKQIEITPESLKFLANTVTHFREEMRGLMDAANGTQARLELQMKELVRQVAKMKELNTRIDQMKKKNAGDGPDGLAQRFKRASETQTNLLARYDKLLQKLMDKYQPELSSQEKTWFEDLKELELEIVKDRHGRGQTLLARQKLAEHQLNLLRPQVKDLVEKKREQDKDSQMGESQVLKLQSGLVEETVLLDKAKAKIDRLTSKLARATLET